MIKFYNYSLHLIAIFISFLIYKKRVGIYNTLIQFSLGEYKFSRYNIMLSNQNFNDSTYRFCLGGAYDFFYSNYLLNEKKIFTFIDIGSNVGLYSCIASRNFNCQNIIAFEPVKSLYLKLIKNLKLNNVNADVYNFGIYSKNTKKYIYFNPDHQGMSSIYKKKNSNFKKKFKCTFKNYKKLKNIFINKEKNYVVKIDVEGAENSVIEQLIKSKIIRYISSIFVEIGSKSDLRSIKSKLKKKNFLLNKSINIKFTNDYLFINKNYK